MKIDFLEESRFNEYEKYLLQDKNALLYTSNKYRNLLKDFLKAEDFYFIAIGSDNKIKGALPLFLKRNDNYGNIANSLPFFGSNGGIIEHEGNYNVKNLLFSAFDSFARENDCVATTIITSPFCEDVNFYESETSYSFRDQRIGQLTRLPKKADNIGDAIMSRIDSVRRRNIRKGLKSGVKIYDSEKTDIINFLAETHKQNIENIGGIYKPERFFELVTKHFTYGDEYKIFIADFDGRPIAALLLFYFNKTVEYFTPVVVEEYRTLQPLSLIVFEAMKDATARGYEWWNWGGTWLTQNGVYNFKKKWGAIDMPYYYYTRIYDENILNHTKEELLSEYPNYFVLPFNCLKHK